MTLVRSTFIANAAAALFVTAGLALAAAPACAAPKAKPKPKAAAPAIAGDPVHGQTVFAQCKVCHSLDAGKNGVGPSLRNIVGTKAAAVPGYTFSAAMQKSGLTWTPPTLSDFLTAPARKVPGTKMPFAGLSNPKDREDVIAYLAKN